MMNRCKTFVVFQISILLVGFGSSPSSGQKTNPGSRSPKVAVSLSLKKGVIAVGEKEVAVITVKNVSSQDVSFPTSRYNFRVYVDGAKGEPPMTMMHRHQRGIYRPGDAGALADGGVTLAIAPGASQSKEFNLTKYYDLGMPGKYKIYMEYRDESGKWLRTNTVTFEIQAPTQ